MEIRNYNQFQNLNFSRTRDPARAGKVQIANETLNQKYKMTKFDILVFAFWYWFDICIFELWNYMKWYFVLPMLRIGQPQFMRLGCPIRTSPDQSLFASYPKLIAGYYVLHRCFLPRHPPYTFGDLYYTYFDCCWQSNQIVKVLFVSPKQTRQKNRVKRLMAIWKT